eukprot:TRINITY_DN77255_c0_g1_i1.p1 TRINITY_DN77255_c0_g1~~TRINITY_DN77255_c0_g1_i1.p1  ORF type:complete len:434 (+),score=91.63 TRINITY_DN77255_c0_g1_i1:74-1375(+)
MLMRARLVLCGLCLLQQRFDVSAWGEAGHERLNRIAQSLLHGKHADQIRTMMHADVIDVADWETKLKARYPETDVLHWHHQSPEWNCGQVGAEKTEHIRCDGHGAESGSLFCALAFFFEHFADSMVLKEYPEPKVPIDTPKQIAALQKVNMDDLYDGKKRKNTEAAHYLRWLTTLVGDLHQPLHWLAENKFGSDVRVVYKGDEYTLLQFWEDFMPKNLPDIPPMSELDLEYKAQYHSWGHRLPPELFREWAGEMSAKVCQEVYAPMFTNHADGSRTIESPFDITQETFLKWQALANQLIQEGGERLALVFLDIIEHKRHKAAAKDGRGLLPPLLTPSEPAQRVDKTILSAGAHRSEYTIPAPVKEKGHSNPKSQLKLLVGLHRARRRRAWTNLCTNAAIAAVVVPLLVAGLHTHSRMGHKMFTSVFTKKKDNS